LMLLYLFLVENDVDVWVSHRSVDICQNTSYLKRGSKGSSYTSRP
jgi:hypothetical protein